MIEVKIIRTGISSKKWFAPNRHGRGAFTLNFKDIEELCMYFRRQNMAVWFAPGFQLAPEHDRVFRTKLKAMVNKNYPEPTRKIMRTLKKRTARRGL